MKRPCRETKPVLPVPEEHIQAILPHLSPQVAAMVRLQHHGGARPQEVIGILPCAASASLDEGSPMSIRYKLKR